MQLGGFVVVIEIQLPTHGPSGPSARKTAAPSFVSLLCSPGKMFFL